MLKPLLHALVALAFISSAVNSAAQELGNEFVEWESESGFSVAAKLVAEDAEKKTITLEKPDGKTVVVPLDKLTEASRLKAEPIIKQLRKIENTIGKWYWRCPAKGQQEWRIESTIVKNRTVYELTETSTGHTQVADTETTFYYKKRGKLFLPIDKKNSDEKRSPFQINANGDRLHYERQLEIDGKILIQGGGFLEINYSDASDAETWTQAKTHFPPVKIRK